MLPAPPSIAVSSLRVGTLPVSPLPVGTAPVSSPRVEAVARPVRPLQADPTGGGLLALVVTFLIAWLFYAVTLHLAATFFVGDVPSQRAAAVGPVPAVVSILLGRYGVESAGFLSPSAGVAVVLLATLVADAIAISSVYRLSWRPATALTVLHFAFAAVLGFALNNLFGFV